MPSSPLIMPTAAGATREGRFALGATAGGALLLAVAPTPAGTALSLALLLAGASMRPRLGLALLATVLPFYLHPRPLGPLAFSVPELVLLATLLGAGLHTLREGRAAPRALASRLTTPFDGPVALFLAAALLSLVASEVLRVSFRDLRTVVVEPVLAFYLVVGFARSGTDRSWLLAGLLLGGMAASGLGLYQYLFSGQVITAEGARRILGPYLSPNHLALYLGRLLPLAVAAALFLPRARVAAAAAAALLAAALLLSFSVGSWLAALLSLSCVLLLWRPRLLPVLLLSAVALAVASPALLTLERVSSHLSLTSGTGFLRLQLWGASLQMILDHPFLGIGMDNFLYHYRSGYLLPEAVAEPNLSHPHNLVLNFWLQMGLPGLAAMGWLLFSLAAVGHRLWRSPLATSERAAVAGIAGSVVALVAHGMVDNSYFLVDLAFYFWLTAGILATMGMDRTGHAARAQIR